jgi:hypothetical protein
VLLQQLGRAIRQRPAATRLDGRGGDLPAENASFPQLLLAFIPSLTWQNDRF